jgi:hypothetical protein
MLFAPKVIAWDRVEEGRGFRFCNEPAAQVIE